MLKKNPFRPVLPWPLIGWILVIVLGVSCQSGAKNGSHLPPVSGAAGDSPTPVAALSSPGSETPEIAYPGPGAGITRSPISFIPTAPATTAATPTPSPASTLTPTATETPIPSPTETYAPPATPTYAILRGKVLQRSNCRYGPGAPYLYKYGLVVGSNLEVFGRNDAGTWILIRAIGGTNPCWVKASLLEVKGDILAVEPAYTPLPQSPYYPPLTGVSAARRGDEVTVSWNAFQLRPGDETASAPYLLEAWVCQAGSLVFIPTGATQNAVTLVDETGCEQPSYGRVYGVEKHGYTRWVEVPWPE